MVLLTYIFLAFSGLTKDIVFPNSGNKYKNNINIPFIGNQKLNAEIITNNSAKIKLSGLINSEGICKYGIYNGDLYVIVNHNLKEIMEKFKIEFDIPEYNIDDDELKFKLYIKLLKFKKNIILIRDLE